MPRTKRDRYYVSNQKWELETVVKRFHKKEGITITPNDIRIIKKLVGRRRVDVYRKIRELFS